MPEASNSDPFLSRKLTADESQSLTNKLRPLLVSHADEEEDINDLLEYTIAMVNNHKTVSYIIEELKGMEMDFCPPDACSRIGDVVATYMSALERGSSSKPDSDRTTQEAKDEKTAKAGNALTMAGALSTSRERKPKKSNAALDAPLQASRDKSKQRGENSNDGKRKDSRGNRGKKEEDKSLDNRRDSRGGRGKSEGGGRDDRRDIRGRAFDRLTGGRDNRRNDHGGRGRGDRDDGRGNQHDGVGDIVSRRRTDGRGDGSRGGRDVGHRSGRDDGQRGGRGRDFRGGRGHEDRRDSHRGRMQSTLPERGGRSDRMSGTRRSRDDFGDAPEFVPGGRGRDLDRSQGRINEGNKRVRTEEHEAVEQLQNFGEQGSYHFHGQGPRFPSGRGRFPRGGRFVGRASFHGQGEENYQNPVGGEDATAQAAVVHPSPIVAATYRGRGSGYRGRGRGRYSYYPGRADVQSMLAAKTWVRKKDGEGVSGEGNGGGEDAAA